MSIAERGTFVTNLIEETNLSSPNYDAIILVSFPGQDIKQNALQKTLKNAHEIDPSLETELAILPLETLPAKRLVHSPTGPIDPDYDDVRVLKEAAFKGIKRALKAGVKKPLFVIECFENFQNSELVLLLGALEALHVNIHVRESEAEEFTAPIPQLGVLTHSLDKTKHLINLAMTLESGRRVACDIGDGDPERMAPPRLATYIETLFANSNIDVTTISSKDHLEKEFPLLAAVNRAASTTQRHQARVCFLKYTPGGVENQCEGAIQETLLLVGKGVTYDTGGIDVKINGAMVGMSRDKCGAAAIVGFMQVVNLLKPKNIEIIAAVGLVRNSVGPEGYVADEIITARSGAKVRVVNTDAEGRMVMADLLCKLKEIALKKINPQLYTVATLTGHVFLTYGEGYTAAIDNGPARKAGTSDRLKKAGEIIGEPFDASVLRREDFQNHRGDVEGANVKQGGALPSSRTARGHQGPAAFLILASGLDKHGSGSDKPLKYTHIDNAGSAGEYPKPSTGIPVLTLAQAYLLN